MEDDGGGAARHDASVWRRRCASVRVVGGRATERVGAMIRRCALSFERSISTVGDGRARCIEPPPLAPPPFAARAWRAAPLLAWARTDSGEDAPENGTTTAPSQRCVRVARRLHGGYVSVTAHLECTESASRLHGGCMAVMWRFRLTWRCIATSTQSKTVHGGCMAVTWRLPLTWRCIATSSGAARYTKSPPHLSSARRAAGYCAHSAS